MENFFRLMAVSWIEAEHDDEEGLGVNEDGYGAGADQDSDDDLEILEDRPVPAPSPLPAPAPETTLAPKAGVPPKQPTSNTAPVISGMPDLSALDPATRLQHIQARAEALRLPALKQQFSFPSVFETCTKTGPLVSSLISFLFLARFLIFRPGGRQRNPFVSSHLATPG